MGIHLLPPLFKIVITGAPGTYTFKPDVAPEVTSVDGRAYRVSKYGESWADIIGSAGTGAYYQDLTLQPVNIGSTSTPNGWWINSRSFVLFDTSIIPVTAIIQAATLSLYGITKVDPAGWLPDFSVYAGNPASNIAIVAADYSRVSAVPFSDAPITYAAFTLSAWNVLTLNDAGRAAIAKGGITKFCLRNANYDVAGLSPAWVASKNAVLEVSASEETPGTERPLLTVTYSVPS